MPQLDTLKNKDLCWPEIDFTQRLKQAFSGKSVILLQQSLKAIFPRGRKALGFLTLLMYLQRTSRAFHFYHRCAALSLEPQDTAQEKWPPKGQRKSNGEGIFSFCIYKRKQQAEGCAELWLTSFTSWNGRQPMNVCVENAKLLTKVLAGT